MKKLRQDGFTAVEAIIVIVILMLMGGAGWLVWHKQQRSSANPSSSTSSNKVDNKPASFTIPNDFKTYTSSDGTFELSYPKAWGTLEKSSDERYSYALAATSNMDGLHFGQSSKLDGALIVGSATEARTSKYGATIKPYKQDDGYIWKVISVNPADTSDKVGDTYPVKSFTNPQGVTIYTFQSRDEDSIYAYFLFEVQGTFYSLTFPSFWTYDAGTDDATNPLQSDLDQFLGATKNVENSVKVK